jgi:hypothetical protein
LAPRASDRRVIALRVSWTNADVQTTTHSLYATAAGPKELFVTDGHAHGPLWWRGRGSCDEQAVAVLQKEPRSGV